MRWMIGTCTWLLMAAGVANAQSMDEVHISVGGFHVATNGAERAAGVVRGYGPPAIGTTTVGIFSFAGCRRFTVTRPPETFEKEADAGWRVEITPLKVVDHAVTFRLRWVRAIDKTGGFDWSGEDVEVTLKPGESRPIDSVPIAKGTKASDGRPCETKAASLRVSADFPQMDRRLIEADIWLVERLPDGKERSQRQSIRGLPHRAMPFYFDGVPDGDKRLDIFGELIADPDQGSIQLAVETAAAQAHPGQTGYQSARWFRSTLNMKPNETVAVALTHEREKPATSDGRVFSIRIQAKQIR
jgi:hypothetical protein